MLRRIGAWRLACYVALVVVLGVRWLSGPAAIDRLYGDRVYGFVQQIFGLLFGWWPFPAMYVWLLGLLLTLAWLVRRAYRQ